MTLRFLIVVIVQCSLLVGCVTPSIVRPSDAKPELGPNQYEVFGQVYEIMQENVGYLEIGIASWYGKKFHGRLTSMGETYDMFGLTAAHKALPLPTVVKVTNLDNGQSIIVRVNDRGPFHEDRLIDLSWNAAKALGFENKGTAPVVVEAMDEVNHPEFEKLKHQGSHYLQVGAFRSRDGAVKQMEKVKLEVPGEVPARILTSETKTGILYKVWIGPLVDPEEESLVALRIRDRNLGKALRVTVE
ncbi:MAG: septal ring lytic transglycosylase RlpA family protein [Candidatus Azotimanducaceae bacterium WSBS_2022_MAG_OTU7]